MTAARTFAAIGLGLAIAGAIGTALVRYVSPVPIHGAFGFNEVTQVRSKLYGKHIRSRRGSKKPALINAAFQKSVELNKLANPVAKVIKDANVELQ